MAIILNIWFWHGMHNWMILVLLDDLLEILIWHLEISQSYLFRDIWVFVMYYIIYGVSAPFPNYSLLTPW